MRLGSWEAVFAREDMESPGLAAFWRSGDKGVSVPTPAALCDTIVAQYHRPHPCVGCPGGHPSVSPAGLRGEDVLCGVNEEPWCDLPSNKNKANAPLASSSKGAEAAQATEKAACRERLSGRRALGPRG